MPSWESWSYAFGPLTAFLVIGALALVLRWATSRGSSVVARTARAGPSDAYGLLVPVATPSTQAEADRQRRRLEGAGLRVTVTTTLDGRRVLVFRDDLARAREILDVPDR